MSRPTFSNMNMESVCDPPHFLAPIGRASQQNNKSNRTNHGSSATTTGETPPWISSTGLQLLRELATALKLQLLSICTDAVLVAIDFEQTGNFKKGSLRVKTVKPALQSSTRDLGGSVEPDKIISTYNRATGSERHLDTSRRPVGTSSSDVRQSSRQRRYSRISRAQFPRTAT